MKRKPSLVLFDLDGTLVDSAPDLAGTANDMRVARGLSPLESAIYRAHCGSGARGMLRCAFDSAPGLPGYEVLRDEFHDRYEQRMLQDTQVFDAAWLMLDRLDAAGLPWGIVTNKAMRFAKPLTHALRLLQRSCVLVGGDSTAYSKPHPAPLLEAARQAGQPPVACIYIGDDERDIQAGRAAGMGTMAAAWGYVELGVDVTNWGADTVLAEPSALLQWLNLA